MFEEKKCSKEKSVRRKETFEGKDYTKEKSAQEKTEIPKEGVIEQGDLSRRLRQPKGKAG